MDLKETYDRIAENWHEDHAGDDWWVPGVDTFISLLRKDSLVLDAGCGAGVKTKYLLSKGLKVIATDFSEKMTELAKQEAPEAEFFVSDIRDAERWGRKFDGILLQAVLLHIPKKEAGDVLRGLVATLNPGGCIYVAVKEKRPGGMDEEMRTEKDYGYEYTRFFSYFSSEEIREMFENAGCEIVYENIAPTKVTRWVQVIGKKK